MTWNGYSEFMWQWWTNEWWGEVQGALKPNICQPLETAMWQRIIHLEIRANQSLEGSEGRCWVSDRMKRKGQVLIWLDNKQLNGHRETVWMAHLALTSVGGWKKITYSRYLHCDWGERSWTYGFDGVLHFRKLRFFFFVIKWTGGLLGASSWPNDQQWPACHRHQWTQWRHKPETASHLAP